MNAYVITVATLVTIQSIAACGLNVIVGYAGQISLGHAAFFGIGAYSSALLTTKAGLSFWTAMPLAVVITALIGAMLGLPSLRVRDDFLAITTIGVNFIVEAVFQYIPFFGGALGIGGIPRVHLFKVPLKGMAYLLFCLAFLAVVLVVCRWFTRSWAGLACFALREEETAASSMGISPVRFKLLAFVVGTAMAGLGGVLYAHFMRFISAGDFSFPVSVMLLSTIVLGGMGTLWGPVLGAAILVSLPESFRPLMELRFLLYTVVLLVMIRFQPGGLLGEASLAQRILARFHPMKADHP
ncbi:branched-chain amino acid ABC transporter permease [Desulfosoma caldarium]|uniref:Branched-chain amino acid transport system permease protein n=1 Tax=Desulfosoma caldarium TaxID=610254 RepID=A0A3N1UQR1_9BACT|nr:branched-chain amino acid ABC transporter permease [Desulfosoma caldarium]ROQ90221.1 branched-chain amino acid transport system permease protein [Desulfosoma caldarium]